MSTGPNCRGGWRELIKDLEGYIHKSALIQAQKSLRTLLKIPLMFHLFERISDETISASWETNCRWLITGFRVMGERF
jgi:hypothetical protein